MYFSTPQNTSTSQQLFAKRFTVLLDVDGEKKILRDIVLADTHDVLELVALHAQLRMEYLAGGQVALVEYFNDQRNAFEPVTEAAWVSMVTRRHLELRLRRLKQWTSAHLQQQRDAAAGLVSSTDNSAAAVRASASDASTTVLGVTTGGMMDAAPQGGGRQQQPQPPVTSGMLNLKSRRARVVDVARRMMVRDARFLTKPTATSTSSASSVSLAAAAAAPQPQQQVNKELLIRLCSVVLQRFQTTYNMSHEAMTETVVFEGATGDGGEQEGARIEQLAIPIVREELDNLHIHLQRQQQQQQQQLQQVDLQPTRVPTTQPPTPNLRPTDMAQPQHHHHDLTPLQSLAGALGLPQGISPVERHPSDATVVDPTMSKLLPGTAALGSNNALQGFQGRLASAPPAALRRTGPAGLTAGAGGFPTNMTPLDDAHGFYDNPLVAAGAAFRAVADGSNSVVSSTQRPVSSMAPVPSSTFQAVHYTIRGRFPPPVYEERNEMAGAYGGGVRVALSAPQAIFPEEDILITAHVISRTIVTLTWWLSYGPHRVTLNLDELYGRGVVTTFQVSETGLLLTIRRGTLVPGWDYHLHLTASSEITGATASDQTTFTLHRSGASLKSEHGGGGGGVESMSNNNTNKHRAPAMRGVTSVQQRHLRGYQGDEDAGLAMSGGGPPPNLFSSPTSTAGPGKFPTPSAASAPPPLPTNQGSPLGAPMPHAIGMTYQEQLKHFFVNEIHPLYRLCSRPNMRQDAFAQMLQGIVHEYWDARPPEAALDVQLQREIVQKVKDEIVKSHSMGASSSSSTAAVGTDAAPQYGASQQGSRYTPTAGSTTNIPPVGLRPQYQSLIRR